MKAMILAAGRGERMRPLTDHTPKPLLAVGGDTMIGWHLRRLAHAGVRDIVINHAWLGAQLEQELGDGARYGVRISWSREASALETAGGIAHALPLLGRDPFLVVNGDVLSDLDFSQVMVAAGGLDGERHLAHLVLVNNPEHHPEGDFTLCADGSVCLEPQPQCPHLTFSGVAVYHPALFAALADAPPARHALRSLLLPAMARAAVSGEHWPGVWLDVGTPERLQQADLIAAHWVGV